MKNRYGNAYGWKQISENEYRFVMEGESLKYGRIGGKEGQASIDMSDLGFFDPSGGPFVGIGSIVACKEVTHIRANGDTFIVEVKND